MADSTAVSSKAPRSASPKPENASAGSVKDTIESILVAFILAFVFRAFVVEAFVIPTGSMAPTLLGAHMRFRCDDCGYEFDVNYNSQSEGDDISIPSNAIMPVRELATDEYGKPIRNANGQRLETITIRPKVFSLHCPNCGYKISRGDATGPAVHYGDRILVLKYLYLFQDPHRWDVVVFKSPQSPRTFDYTQNYIKRLVGKPGETLVILDGDVYVQKTDGGPFEVQNKPYVVQESMWRIVYDNDFHPVAKSRTDGPTWKQPWTPKEGSTGWTLSGDNTDAGRVFRFANSGGASTIFFDAAANPRANHLTDWLAYDATADYEQSSRELDTYNSLHSMANDKPVSDLKLSLFYERHSGEGPLRLKLTKYGRTFVAEIAPGKISLIERMSDGKDVPLGSRDVSPSSQSRPTRIEFANVDYRVALRIDGEELLATTPAQYAPEFDELLRKEQSSLRPPLPTVQIEADHQACSISHLSLWRDVYYTNSGGAWGLPNKFPDQVIRLKEDEYFVLGDNSRISGDARYWTDPIRLPDEDLDVESGRVPGRFMLGKAFFVYWPGGFRPMPRAPGVVPNFGKMRFIH